VAKSIPGVKVGVLSPDMRTLLGYGIYEGDFEHPVLKRLNPRMLLDSGERVWGCECWWGAEVAADGG